MASRSPRAGFTAVEVSAVLLIAAILAVVLVPRFFRYQASTRSSSAMGTLGAVRSGIANYYAETALGGTAAYPTLAQLTDGSTIPDGIPLNPYDSSNDVTFATSGQAAVREVIPGTSGWAYYDGSAGGRAVFYANSNTAGENAW